MAEDKLLKRVSSEPSGRPRLSEIFDPTAFEERLKLARVRRAVALAQRQASGPETGVPGGTRMQAARWAESGPGFEPVVAPVFAAAKRTVPPRPEADPLRPPQRAEPPRPRSARPTETADRWTIEPPGAGFWSAPAEDLEAPDPASGASDRWAPDSRTVSRERTAAHPIGPSPLARAHRAVSRIRAPARLLPIIGGFFLAGLGIGTVAIFLAPREVPAPVPAPAQPVRSASIAPAATPTPVAPPPAPVALTTPSPPAKALPPAPDAAAPLPIRLAAGRPLPRPATITAPAPGEPPASDSAAAAPDLARIRVFVHFPPSVGSAAREAELAALRQGGFATVEPIRARASIDTTNVRYFHAEDADAARLLATTLGDGAVVRDFTALSPPPRKGRLEVWIEGTAPRTSTTPEAILQILQTRGAQN